MINSQSIRQTSISHESISGYRITVSGRVQGVGFRPFVYRLATALKLTGTVQNTSAGVVIELEGAADRLELFMQRLRHDLPAPANIQQLIQQKILPSGHSQFEILSSQTASQTVNQSESQSTHPPSTLLSTRAQILPDLSICSDCLQDIISPHNRRYQYPFTNCTHCGPRFSIITALPYDRDHTTMAEFVMCSACQKEYNNPQRRRFHAQPNACPQCGPMLSFWQVGKHYHQPSLEVASAAPLRWSIDLLTQGKILAMKGLGGFQLLVDACNPEAIATLRQRKGRPDKPLALMCPSLDSIRHYCDVSKAAAELLSSPQGPIVLLPKRSQNAGQTKRFLEDKLLEDKSLEDKPLEDLANNIAPNSRCLGVMLPTTPLHHLLLQQYGAPLVATSGNVSGEPICTHEPEARWRLITIADAFLSHNRLIQRPIDDSVAQLVDNKPQILRQARGYTPQVIQGPIYSAAGLNANTRPAMTKRPCVLALGAQLKSAIAVSTGDEIMLSQHIGDLNTPRAIAQLRKNIRDFLSLYRLKPDAIACDQHPDYASARVAQTLATEGDIPLIRVQHHYAHILSCITEHQLQGSVLGVAWDGTGYGAGYDIGQTVWGGEFLQTTPDGFERVAHFLPYFLPGGDCCAQEPRRSALGLLYSCYGEAAFEMTDLAPMQAFKAPQLVVLRKMLSGKINTPVTSSVGRLFDGVAALLNLHQIISYEGQAAQTLEAAAHQSPVKGLYPFQLSDSSPCLIDWRPMVKAIVADCRHAVMTPVIAAKFHNTMAEIIVAISKHIGLTQVALAGGCFQNVRLSEQVIRRLSAEGFTPYWPQQVPPNDGGLAVGQVMAAWRQLSGSSEVTLPSGKAGKKTGGERPYSTQTRSTQSCA